MQSILCSPNYSVIVLLLLYVVSFILLLTPGILASVPLLRTKKLEPSQVTLFAFGVAALCGYLFFWLFLLNHVVGKLISFGAVIILLMVYLDPYLRKVIIAVVSARDILVPCVLILLIGIYYIAIVYLGYFDDKVCAHENVRFVLNRLVEHGSPDYLIQKIWVDKLFANASPWNIVLDPDMAHTTVGDRPPVLGGIALMFFTWVPQALEHFYFMAITTVASMSWIAGIWVVCRAVKLSRTRSLLFVLALSQTFYFYFSSVFTWPKSLSGALFIGAFTLLALRPVLQSQRASVEQIFVGSVFAGLSFLTHNSTMLLLLPLGFLLLVPRFFPGIRGSLLGVVVFASIVVPYVTVKSVNDPSLSNLTKYTMTTPDSVPVEPDENKRLSIQEAVKKAYSALSMREIIDNKLYNISAIFAPGCFGKCNGLSMKESYWVSEFLPIAGSMKFFNLGWLLFLPLSAFAILLYGKSQSHARFSSNLARLNMVSIICAGIAAAGLLIYALISFRQGVVNIFSSGFMILLFLGVGLRLFALRSLLVAVFLLCLIVYFQWIILQVVVEDRLTLVPAMVGLYGVSALILIILPFWFFRGADKSAFQS